ncbi:WAP four-disulfide core domain protein 1 isoform X2 [Rhinatrema bivittatum]|uniref:WAP four-disulfide core domain protein 1 isoform X2 n=1 Tax=Rhinatrema bivittatum TaxID=194408 RepID=UPI00112D01B8|nr:WAP four-disulfide core domain protein 1 isoform X2 [Rhinatrema bivittatum]
MGAGARGSCCAPRWASCSCSAGTGAAPGIPRKALRTRGLSKSRWKCDSRGRITPSHFPSPSLCQDYEYPLRAQKNERCPPPPQLLPEQACEGPGCRSDSQCGRHRRCCYNGCLYACLDAVQPPPVLDWLVQPKPRWLGGNGWLLDGPEETLQAEACSTTEDGDEPLRCPTGYECHIINPGNPAEGIPNRGQCIKQHGKSDGRNLRHKYYKDYSGNNFNNLISYEKQQEKQLG